jgi:carbon storage regulator
MLVLSRQRDESILIGDNIVITVVDIRGDKVRIGISTDDHSIPVHRQEVYEAIRREHGPQNWTLVRKEAANPPAPETLTYPDDNAKGADK